MKFRVPYVLPALILCIAATSSWWTVREKRASILGSRDTSTRWNPATAAQYLDSREVWWQNWPAAQMDHGTVCISCHTVVTYALVRPNLRHELDEKGIVGPEQVMLASIEKRVTDWADTPPFYSDAAFGPGKTAQSRATEAVLNAVILASYDATEGHLSPVTRTAFNEAWALQEKAGEDAGGWQWQDFHLAPWESTESAYQGAALFAVALGEAPDNYDGETGVRENVEGLRQYLRRQYDAQPLMSKLYVLWASRRTPGLLTEDERAKLIGQITDVQLSDGGWALSSLDEQSRKQAWLDKWKQLTDSAESDGCATGLVVVAMESAGTKPYERTLQRGLQWLEQHQAKDGSWWATSLNGARDDSSDIGRFMSDAATGYAVLALQIAGRDRLASPEADNGHQGEMSAVQTEPPPDQYRDK
jgi:squalene-hopene/tetraprenyl-beta-curcumene cyclase